MVQGLEKFKEFFAGFEESYIVIGGTACDLILSDAGLTPRATKDIDIILVVEALSKEFGEKFWEFIEAGGYQQRERSPEKLEYFRFLKPSNTDFPKQLELFARTPDTFDLPPEAQLSPIPVDDDITSLSAILMDEAYYRLTIAQSTSEEGLHLANTLALIILKAKAFLDLSERAANGEQIDKRKIAKHKTDVFRLALLLTENDSLALPEAIQTDMKQFLEIVKGDLPDKELFKALGAGPVDAKPLVDLIRKTFNLHGQ